MCAVVGPPSGHAALFALAGTGLCGDAFKLNFQGWETESVLSLSESVPFSTQAGLRATGPTWPSFFQWALCSPQEEQPLLNVMVWSDPS